MKSQRYESCVSELKEGLLCEENVLISDLDVFDEGRIVDG